MASLCRRSSSAACCAAASSTVTLWFEGTTPPPLISNPDERRMILTFSPSVSSTMAPQMTLMSGFRPRMKELSSPISAIVVGCSDEKQSSKSRCVASEMSLSSSRGDLMAAWMALVTRCSPLAVPVEMRATPEPRRVVETSAKSRLTWPWRLMMSEMERAAMASVSSAFENALKKSRSG